MLILVVTTGCSSFPFQKVTPPDPPLRLLVTQIRMDAPLTSPTDLRSFDEKPSAEEKPILLEQLIKEVETSAQKLFTEQLALQPGFIVTPFDEARKMHADIDPSYNWLNKMQRSSLGAEAGVDIVLSGRILDFGKVQWRYWVTGLILSMTVETLLVGAATGFNPSIMAIAAASELVTDLPLWWGGAYIAGWALRPVRVKVNAIQITGCKQTIWKDQELIVLIPGKSLQEYPPEDRKRKEIQLGVNLQKAFMEIAKSAGSKLRLKSCLSLRMTR